MFSSNDDSEFLELRDSLVELFQKEESERPWLAEALLDFKWNYQLGGPLEWTPETLETVLLELFPAKTMWDDDDYFAVGSVIARFFRMLGASGLMPRVQATALASHAEAIGDDVALRALDPASWAPGKRILRHATGGGAVDLSDPDEINRIMEEFNALSFEERKQITGEMAAGSQIQPLVPITLPDEAELRAAAADTRLLRWLRLLVDHVGARLAVTTAGNLKVADGKELYSRMDHGRDWDKSYAVHSTVELGELDMTYRIALATGILRQSRNDRVEPGPALNLLERPLEAVEAGWLAMIDSSTWVADVEWLGHRVEQVWEDLSNVMLGLYADPRPIAELVAIKQRTLGDTGSRLPGSVFPDAADYHVRRCLDVLGDLGFVTVTGVTEIEDEYGLKRRAGGIAAPTPLGLWAAQRHFSQFASAPVVGGLRDATAAELIAAMDDLGDATADGELHAWVEAHGESGLRSLAEQTMAGSETVRVAAWRTLAHLDSVAVQAVRGLEPYPDVDAHVAVWIAAVEGEGLFALNPDGSALRFVQLVAAAVDIFGAADAAHWADPAAGAAGVKQMIGEAWRLDDKRVALVLGTIGEFHRKRPIAKAARTAHHKHTSRWS